VAHVSDILLGFSEPSEMNEGAVDGGDRMDEDPQPKDPNDLSQYKLDDYDEDAGGIGMQALYISNVSTRSNIIEASGPFSNIKGLTYYRDNEDDPYITLKEVSKIVPPMTITLTKLE
jgi:periodic tryptophan protein 1